MPKTGIRLVFDMETRDKYKKVDCEIGLTVEGRELPNASVLGEAMEAAVEMIRTRVRQSYEVVPPRPEVPAPVTQAQELAPVVPPQVAQQPPVEQLPRPTNPVPFGS